MSRKEYIPIPPPAPIPEAESLDAEALKRSYENGEVDIICVMGPTASGKTKFAVQLAKKLNELCRRDGGPLKSAEILSGDSRQVYVGMDLGTGKDLEDYQDIPYHLIDIAPAGARYNICQYQQDFSAAYSDCLQRGVIPILCGGSGLYVEAVTKPEYKMEENQGLNLLLPKKPFYLATVIDRETRRQRIDRRLQERLDAGMVDEVRGLLAAGVSAESLIFYGLEYKFLTQYIIGEISYEYMVERLNIAIHQFAKRQMTWLRGMERDGVAIHWVKPE